MWNFFFLSLQAQKKIDNTLIVALLRTSLRHDRTSIIVPLPCLPSPQLYVPPKKGCYLRIVSRAFNASVFSALRLSLLSLGRFSEWTLSQFGAP